MHEPDASSERVDPSVGVRAAQLRAPRNSMDDDALYGPVVYRLPRGEAEERGLVVPLRLVFVNATEAYEELTRREPRVRVLLDATARSVSREHARRSSPKLSRRHRDKLMASS